MRQRIAARSTGVFWEPNHIPLATTRPMVTTIHDLSVIEIPQCHPPDRVRVWEAHFERLLAHTDRFICVSRATGDAMMRCFGISPQRIRVVHLAPTWASRPDGWSGTACRAAIGLPVDSVVHVGTIEPRKNIKTLLDAAHIRFRRGEPGRLVLLGGLGWGNRRFWAQLLEHPAAEHVLWADAPGDEQVLAALIGSRGLVCPSFYEGFGLPPLEAMAIGRRAVISTAPSLVEIAGPAALQLAPRDIEGWAEAMGMLLENDPAAERAARAQAQRFTWARTAHRHAETFAELAAERASSAL